MKVLLINGSPLDEGNTMLALREMTGVFAQEGIETVLYNIGARPVAGCTACGACRKLGKCAIDDAVNEVAPLFEAADGVVIGSPVYYAQPNAAVSALLQRLFYSTAFDKTMKVGAAVSVARRGGLSCTFDDLNKYFTISGMPVASSYYWNSVHGGAPGEAAGDAEGLHTVRALARNMAFLMKSVALGKEEYGLPEKEPKPFTNFIR